MTRTQLVERVLYTTQDPTVTMNAKPLPAMTTLLHRVCDNDQTRFNEAVRLIELFVGKALEIARENP
jgi:hypothetical protein